MLRVLKRQGDRLEELSQQLAKQGERLDIVVKMFRHKFEQ